jgi:hypothetical protein
MTDHAGDEKPKATFEDMARAVGDDVVEMLDSAVDKTSTLIGGEDGNRLVGGAVVGALAAIVLPFSLLTGALLGAGYAAYRKLNK